jgi:OOP family OmpA-OmpF porin
MIYSKKLFAAGLLAAVSTMAIAGAAKADPLKGPYLGLGAGGTFPQSFSNHGSDFSGSASYNPGFAGSFSAGYSFGNGWRGEFELGYLQADVKDYSGGLGDGPTGGTLKQFSYLVNGIYDFDNLGWPVIPHLGLGVGASSIHQSSSNGNGTPVVISLGGTRFSYQGIAGIEYPILPGLNLGLDYRFLSTVNAKAGASADGISLNLGHGDLYTHNILLTLRYTFAPPAAPAPVPAPAPAPAAAPAPTPEAQRAFQVFFDFNKFDITAEAAATIQKAADETKSGHITTINVTGHTDTVGTVKYNLKLSERRADAVKRQLVADGVPGDEISTTGVGKSGLLVPTPDGVREPQNRRAEIVLH